MPIHRRWSSAICTSPLTMVVTILTDIITIHPTHGIVGDELNNTIYDNCFQGQSVI